MKVDDAELNALYKRLDKQAEKAGYHLNPDEEFTKGLVEGLLVNEKRYGYWACPCRLADGKKELDLDIICPCDYRDPDLNEYGNCYCALYVSKAIKDGKEDTASVPERRPIKKDRIQKQKEKSSKNSKTLTKEDSLPIWRCRVCGYLCARNEPPEVCPICFAKKDRFERFH